MGFRNYDAFTWVVFYLFRILEGKKSLEGYKITALCAKSSIYVIYWLLGVAIYKSNKKIGH